MTAGDGHCIQGCPAGSILCRNVPGQKIPPKHTWTSYIWVWILRIPAKSLLCWGLISLSRQAPSSSGFKPELLLSLGSALSLSIQPPLSSFYFFCTWQCCKHTVQALWHTLLLSLKPRSTSRNSSHCSESTSSPLQGWGKSIRGPSARGDQPGTSRACK